MALLQSEPVALDGPEARPFGRWLDAHEQHRGRGAEVRSQRRLSDEAVQEVLEDIRRDAGGVSLHALKRAVGADGATVLGKGRMALLGAR